MNKLIESNINLPIINLISKVAIEMDVKVYLVGGFVRDILLFRKSKDIDVLVVGDGIEFAKIISKKTENFY